MSWAGAWGRDALFLLVLTVLFAVWMPWAGATESPRLVARRVRLHHQR